ncbi:MAG TPA: rod shape-determining protein MreC [Agriterribacter sp.]|nr:rod shape-determining protein MreC [Agriterribacter sp.]
MRNVFIFIRRYFNFLFFIIMQAVALYMLFQFNKFHEGAFMGVASEVTGKISKQYNTVEYYFQLKKTNELLVQENQKLRNLLKTDFLRADTTSSIVVDSIKVDSLEQFRKYLYFPAKVINNSVTSQINYLTINRGRAQGIVKDMAVVSSAGVVGTVINVSRNMATVMSLLHRQTRISASLLKTGETGTVEWDGQNPQLVTFKNIPKTVQVQKGDTVVTSPYSTFPPGQQIGIVAEIEREESSNFYTLKLRPSTNFFNVQFVYAVQNLQKEEQDAIEKGTNKQQ